MNKNRIIAEFEGYKYYHPGVDIDTSDCGGIYERFEIFSKTPILVDEYPEADQFYFSEVPNPDYKNESPTTWRKDLETLSWASINYQNYITNIDYDKSWDRLMPIYVKCLTIIKNLWNKDKSDLGGFMICVKNLNQCSLILDDVNGVYDEDSMRIYMHNSVVDFIEWYNKNINYEI